MFKKSFLSFNIGKLTIFCFCGFLFNCHTFSGRLRRESEINYATAILSDQNVNFHGRDLRGDSFEKTILFKVNFKDSKLQDANFRKACLWRVNFKNVDLTKASFENSRLIGVDFRRANLKQVDFRGAILKNVDFRGAQLQGAILSPTCRLPQYEDFKEVVFIYLNASQKDKKILEYIFDFREL